MPSGFVLSLPVIIGALGALGCLIGAFSYFRRKRIIDDLPTSKAQGVFIGLTELKGTAESETPVTSYLAGVQCVQYSWRVDEHWSRTVHETYHDSHGKTHTRTRTESGWTNVARGGKSPPFYIQDDTGITRIVPEGATIQGITTFDKTCTPRDALYFEKGPLSEIANSDHRRRFVETVLPLHAVLYVIGQARERKDIVAAEIASDNSAPMFLISTRTEKQISSVYGRWFWFWLVLGIIIALGGAAVWNWFNWQSLSALWQPYLMAMAGFLLALLIGWVWVVFNSLINLHHRVEQAWSQVDVQLKRRHDLISNLVQVVAGYRNHEVETQQLVAELRRQLVATQPGIKGPDFKGLAPLLRVTMERYPALKANEQFLKLQHTLVDTEQRIALARDYFNETTTFYNTRLEIIPDRFVARIARLQPQALMNAPEFERAPVPVTLVG